MAPWIAFGLFLFILFGAIVYYPAWHARTLGQNLASESPQAAQQAAEALIRMGGSHALHELARIAEYGGRVEVRMRAIQALGEFPGPGALGVLRRIEAASQTEEVLRLAARDAIALHERMRPNP